MNWLSLWLDILESVGFCAVAQCELLGSSGRNSICLWLCVCAMQSLRLFYTGHNFSKSIFVFSLASILMLDIELTHSLALSSYVCKATWPFAQLSWPSPTLSTNKLCRLFWWWRSSFFIFYVQETGHSAAKLSHSVSIYTIQATQMYLLLL